jgi:ABC-type multidrug transport system fused ATPase/permease subunit
MWYYQNNDGQRHGPVTVEDLTKLARSWSILPSTLVWREGMKEWAPACRVKGLFTEEQKKAGPPQPPPLPSKVAIVTKAPSLARRVGHSVAVAAQLLIIAVVGLVVMDILLSVFMNIANPDRKTMPVGGVKPSIAQIREREAILAGRKAAETEKAEADRALADYKARELEDYNSGAHMRRKNAADDAEAAREQDRKVKALIREREDTSMFSKMFPSNKRL